MALSTDIKIVSAADKMEVFHCVRSILGIPRNHPFRPFECCSFMGQRPLKSNPGIFGVDVIVAGAGRMSAEAIEEAKDQGYNVGPLAWNVHVSLDTPYTYDGIHGSASGVHNYVIAKLMEKMPGLDFWAQDEFDGTWHHNAIPYA